MNLVKRRRKMEIERVGEGELSAKLKSSLEKINCLVMPFTANVRSMKGIPDRRVIHRDFRFFAEIKVPPNKPEKAQKQLHQELWKRRDYAFILYLTKDSIQAAILFSEKDFEKLLAPSPYGYDPMHLRTYFIYCVKEYDDFQRERSLQSMRGV